MKSRFLQVQHLLLHTNLSANSHVSKSNHGAHFLKLLSISIKSVMLEMIIGQWYLNSATSMWDLARMKVVWLLDFGSGGVTGSWWWTYVLLAPGSSCWMTSAVEPSPLSSCAGDLTLSTGVFRDSCRLNKGFLFLAFDFVLYVLGYLDKLLSKTVALEGSGGCFLDMWNHLTPRSNGTRLSCNTARYHWPQSLLLLEFEKDSWLSSKTCCSL